MGFLEIFGIAVGLGSDALAVSFVAGTVIRRITPRHVFRIAFHFGLFQFMMPVAGWFAGKTFCGFVEPWGGLIAAGLLVFIALKMFAESFAEQSLGTSSDPSRGWMLVSLSVATSIDALAAGASMALMNVTVFVPALLIGVITSIMCIAGIYTGGRLGESFGRGAMRFGAAVLLVIAGRVFWSV